MTASIRGHQTRVDLAIEGKPVSIDTITNFSANMDSDFMRSQYVGNPVPEGDQTVNGWSGSMDMEVKSDIAELIIDAVIAGNLNGVGVTEIAIVDTEDYPDGSTASYMYIDIQMKISKTFQGQNTKVTKKLDWQAARRKRL